jgi:site-specific DNA-methyltransferase (adenine-specific)
VETKMTENKLYFGDNLDILRNRDYFPNECVDLIYLDPPFNSNRDYNVLFKDESGNDSDAQIVAFGDTWHWGPSAAKAYYELVTHGTERVARTIGALHDLLGENQMMAYLVMMAIRLVEMHRVLKNTGGIYLHCDPTASHYLKIVMDAIFDVENFRNEITWKRTAAKGLATRRLPTNHDLILFYQKSDQVVWNLDATFLAYDKENLDPKTAGKYTQRDADGRLYQLSDLTNPNPNRPNLTYEFLGVTKVWRWTKERMQKAYEKGLIVQPRAGSLPRYKRYLDEQRGKPLGDVWADIAPLNSQAKERLGYPTQKPLALLERIIQLSSNPGGIVLDPFCGCGTAIAAAQKLGRKWIGIDVTILSITLQQYRLRDMFALYPKKNYAVVGEPTTLSEARALAKNDEIEGTWQFQAWGLSKVQAKPLGDLVGSRNIKKGKDRGVDGIINFIDDNSGKRKEALVQVKSGKNIQSKDIRDLRGAMARRESSIGVFITLEEPTRDMIAEAISAGFYDSPGWGRQYPKIQILTIEQLLEGTEVKMPPPFGTFKQAPRVKGDPQTRNMTLDEAPRNGENEDASEDGEA